MDVNIDALLAATIILIYVKDVPSSLVQSGCNKDSTSERRRIMESKKTDVRGRSAGIGSQGILV